MYVTSSNVSDIFYKNLFTQINNIISCVSVDLMRDKTIINGDVTFVFNDQGVLSSVDSSGHRIEYINGLFYVNHTTWTTIELFSFELAYYADEFVPSIHKNIKNWVGEFVKEVEDDWEEPQQSVK